MAQPWKASARSLAKHIARLRPRPTSLADADRKADRKGEESIPLTQQIADTSHANRGSTSKCLRANSNAKHQILFKCNMGSLRSNVVAAFHCHPCKGLPLGTSENHFSIVYVRACLTKGKVGFHLKQNPAGYPGHTQSALLPLQISNFGSFRDSLRQRCTPAGIFDAHSRGR